jgi:hypothetical protein
MQRPEYKHHTVQEIIGFVLVMAVFFGGLSLWAGIRTEGWAPPKILSAIAFGFALIGWLLPKSLRPIYHLWMLLAFCLNFVVSRVLLSVVFYGFMWPLGMLMRATQKSKRPSSGWQRYREQAPRDHFEHLYTLSHLEDAAADTQRNTCSATVPLIKD